MGTPTHLPPSRILGAIPQSGCISVMDFAVPGVKTQSIPARSKMVFFSASQGFDFYASLTGTAVVPSGDTTDGSANVILNPSVRSVSGATNISVATAGTGILVLEYFK